MNPLMSRSPPERRSPARTKNTLFCPDCDRSAPLDGWTLTADADGETLSCPDCDASLAVVTLA